MFEAVHRTYNSDEERYAGLREQSAGLIHDERDPIANMANLASLLYHALPNVNWVGFYRYIEDNDELVLGPFHGLPACIRIKNGRGVCGTATAGRRTVRVEDVNLFPGHIACDAASQSELVVPLIHGERIVGVLDIDSPVKNRFTALDQSELEYLVEQLVQGCDWA